MSLLHLNYKLLTTFFFSPCIQSSRGLQAATPSWSEFGPGVGVDANGRQYPYAQYTIYGLGRDAGLVLCKKFCASAHADKVVGMDFNWLEPTQSVALPFTSCWCLYSADNLPPAPWNPQDYNPDAKLVNDHWGGGKSCIAGRDAEEIAGMITFKNTASFLFL
jgi:hypothetical protein